MTRYTVVWDDEVYVPFLNAWLAGDTQTRRILTDVANWVDTHLAEDPNLKGEPRHEHSTRILAVPLSKTSAHVVVTYQVLMDDRLVRVLRLRFRNQ
jgi:hypothetical protein